MGGAGRGVRGGGEGGGARRAGAGQPCGGAAQKPAGRARCAGGPGVPTAALRPPFPAPAPSAGAVVGRGEGPGGVRRGRHSPVALMSARVTFLTNLPPQSRLQALARCGGRIGGGRGGRGNAHRRGGHRGSPPPPPPHQGGDLAYDPREKAASWEVLFLFLISNPVCRSSAESDLGQAEE